MLETMSPAAQDFISKILVKDPAHRLCTAADMKRHAFFNGIDWAHLGRLEVPCPGFTKIPSAEEVLSAEQIQELVNECSGTGTAKPQDFMGFTFDAKGATGGSMGKK